MRGMKSDEIEFPLEPASEVRGVGKRVISASAYRVGKF